MKNVHKFKDVVQSVLKNSSVLTQERFDIIKDYYTSRKETDDLYKYKDSKLLENSNMFVDSILNTITLDKCIDVFETQMKFDDWYISVDSDEFKNF